MSKNRFAKQKKKIKYTAIDLSNGVAYGNYDYRKKERRGTYLFIAVFLTLIALLVGWRIYWVNHFAGVAVSGTSMQQTLQSNDELIMRYSDGSDAERGDIIVVDVRKYTDKVDFLIKRLIAVEGDVVECEKGQVYITYAGTSERVALEEPYAYYSSSVGKYGYNFGKYTVGAGEIFFLGDNRLNSIDSRYQEKNAAGEPIYSHIDGLYKATDIVGVVPEWSVKLRPLWSTVFFRQK